jgi:hypothetical protein
MLYPNCTRNHAITYTNFKELYVLKCELPNSEYTGNVRMVEKIADSKNEDNKMG